jgi:hypothetical protein
VSFFLWCRLCDSFYGWWSIFCCVWSELTMVAFWHPSHMLQFTCHSQGPSLSITGTISTSLPGLLSGFCCPGVFFLGTACFPAYLLTGGVLFKMEAAPTDDGNDTPTSPARKKRIGNPLGSRKQSLWEHSYLLEYFWVLLE